MHLAARIKQFGVVPVVARCEVEMDFFSRLRVVTLGKFVVPPSRAEEMFRPMVYGLAGGRETLNVGDPK